ncbi:MAG: T9SS type A sorting domain-containing protein [Bacteroidetes bacterium]|nr:T9SS type A sorting domain-containing protein [Bacteroidota bacterium]
MDTIYFFRDADIFSSVLHNNIWSSPKKLISYINDGSPLRSPVISKDSKRLYFSKWGGYGAWDLYCSYWDSTTNDWEPALNLGPNINSYSGEYYAYELSPDTLYCINDRWAGMGVCIYKKDSLTKDWKIIDSSNYNHPLGAGDIRGLSITSDRKKAYFSRYISAYDHTGDSLQSQLYVTYWDKLNNRWGDVYELNINSKAYQIKVSDTWSYWIGGWDEYPWISPDGKTLYFVSNRDAARKDTNHPSPDIYISHLIVDDHGDTVTAINDRGNIPYNYNLKLFPNYPNPFNPSTTIKYIISKYSHVSLKVYDLLGREVQTLVSEEKPAGEYQTIFSATNLSSGVYFYILKADGYSASRKLILLK